jgi:hypothetical protein
VRLRLATRAELLQVGTGWLKAPMMLQQLLLSIAALEKMSGVGLCKRRRGG